MPCDSVEKSRIEFLATTTDVTLLAKGLRARGFTVQLSGRTLYFTDKYGRSGSYDAKTGRLDVPRSFDTNEIKRAYGEATVDHEAEQNGWQIEWETNPEGDRQATVTKRQ